MRILVLGGDGMLGHELLLMWRGRHEVFVTLRQDRTAYESFGLFDSARTFYGVDVGNLQALVDVVGQVRPDAVVNAVGIVKQRPSAKDSILSLEINALFPHRLAQVCKLAGARLIHLSTDCVFSGSKGAYLEADAPDATDLYGRTKLLGEVGDANCLTLRTSIIGLELSRKKSLIEWFLAQKGRIKGFRRAIYSGLTTREMSRAIEHFLLHERELSGVWHLASEPINKFELLVKFSELLGRKDIEIQPEEDFVCDRSLNATALWGRTSYRVPSWDQMLSELASEFAERKASK